MYDEKGGIFLKLYSTRRLIVTDFDELKFFVESTRKNCGYMTQSDIEFFIKNGRVLGVFKGENLCLAAFCGTVGKGFCTDKMLHGIAFSDVEFCYIRVADGEGDSIFRLIENTAFVTRPLYTILHYQHIENIAFMLDAKLELSALRGGVGNKPYMLLQSGVSTQYSGNYCFCRYTDSKELSRLLEQGYNGVAAMGKKLVLAEILEKRSTNDNKTKDCGA